MKYLTVFLVVGIISVSSCSKKEHHLVEHSTMSSEELSSLRQSLEQLDMLLKEKAPKLHARFAGGASEQDIKLLRSSLNGAKIDSIELWFKWHNGSTEPMLGLLPLGEMISIESSLQDKEAMKYIGKSESLRAKSIMLLEDGAGDGFFLDVTSSPPRVFYEMLEHPYPSYYGTLYEFVGFISKGWELGIFSEDKEGYFDYNEDEFEKYANTYLAETDKI